MYTDTERNLTAGINLLESGTGDNNLFSFYVVTFFVTIIIVNSLVSYEGPFISEVHKKVVFTSIVLDSTYNVFKCGEGGPMDALFPAGPAPCCAEGPQRHPWY